MMALTGVITSFVTHPGLAVTRYAAGSRVNGRWVSGGTSMVNIDACIQPITGRMLEYLPEAHKSKELRLLLTVTELFTMRADREADTVSIDGENWSVISVKPWKAFGGNASGDHYECVVARIPAP